MKLVQMIYFLYVKVALLNKIVCETRSFIRHCTYNYIIIAITLARNFFKNGELGGQARSKKPQILASSASKSIINEFRKQTGKNEATIRRGTNFL